jgi:hypothetical protein
MRQRSGVLVSAAIAGLAASASAQDAEPSAGNDSLEGLRGLLEEREHGIELTVTPGHATLVVRRIVENLGKRHDQATWSIHIPETAVATGLRTRGILDGRPHWFAGELMEAEAAAAKYRELTGIGGYSPKDPALLSWRRQGILSLQVFPVPPGERKTVGYTVKMPTQYRDGRHELTLPVMGAPSAAATVVVRPARSEDRLLVGGQPFPAGGRLVWPDEPAEIVVALAPAWAPAVGGAFAAKRFADGRVLVRYRIEAAPRLGHVPRDAQVIVILDWSRSLSEDECDAGVAGATAFLRHFHGAAVEVLTVDRQVRRRHRRFVPVGQALGDLAGLSVERRNGSDLDAALALADELLAAAPPGRARRVLLLSDLMTRSALDVATLQRVLRRSGALLHVGTINLGPPALDADFEGPWSAVARATGGLLWLASLSAATDDRASLLSVVEEWARPVRLHRFRASVPLVDLAPSDGKDALEAKQLAEGQSVAGLQIAGAAPPWMQISGQLWAKPVRARFAPDAAEARLWSALVFGQPLRDDLDDKEMLVLARHGGAVSPVTSYLAIEPGVRPSTEGIEEAFGVGGLGLIGTGSGGARIGERTVRAPFDHLAWVRDALRPSLAKCGYRRSASVTLETTISEVVDVPAVSANERGDRACLREATWALDLPDDFTAERKAWTVRLAPD